MANQVLQNEIEAQEGIFEFVNPQDVDIGEWLENHTDCDAIVDDRPGNRMTVYAYTREPAYNFALSQYQQEHFGNYTILSGIPSYVLNGVL